MNHPLLIQVPPEVFEWLKKKGREFSTDTTAAMVAKEIVIDTVRGFIEQEADDEND